MTLSALAPTSSRNYYGSGFSSMANAYTADDGTYSTASPGRDTYIEGRWGNFNVATLLPADAIINWIEVWAKISMSTSDSTFTWWLAAMLNTGGGAYGDWQAPDWSGRPDTSDVWVGSGHISPTPTRAQLANGQFELNIAIERDLASLNARTCYVEGVELDIDYYIPLLEGAGGETRRSPGAGSIAPVTYGISGAGGETRRLGGSGQFGVGISGAGGESRRIGGGGSMSIATGPQLTGGGGASRREPAQKDLIARAQKTGWFSDRYHI